MFFINYLKQIKIAPRTPMKLLTVLIFYPSLLEYDNTTHIFWKPKITKNLFFHGNLKTFTYVLVSFFLNGFAHLRKSPFSRSKSFPSKGLFSSSSICFKISGWNDLSVGKRVVIASLISNFVFESDFERGMVAPELFFLFWSGKFGILTQNEV